MGYYVEHPGGQRYGPADVATLNQWAAEGRLMQTTVLIDAVTGSQFFAQDVPGIQFPGVQQATVMQGPPVGTPLGGYSSPQSTYTPYGAQTPLNRAPGRTSSAITTSYVASAFGIVMLCCLPIIGVLAGLAGIGLALSARNIDPRGAKMAIGFGVAAVVLNIGMTIAGEMFMRMLTGR